ncbi:MAG: hypothetical protein IKL39_02730, partial [Mailhella sp.]|nr:hypothetical protein [Mailhella sp.]
MSKEKRFLAQSFPFQNVSEAWRGHFCSFSLKEGRNSWLCHLRGAPRRLMVKDETAERQGENHGKSKRPSRPYPQYFRRRAVLR